MQITYPDVLFPSKNFTGTMEGPDYSNTIHTNDNGIREDKNYTRDHVGVFRVAMIGDSFTFGNSADNNETIDSVLEAIVNSNTQNNNGEKPIEFLNLGKPGIGPSEYSDVMLFAEDAYRPDAYIAVVYLGNDFLNSQEKHHSPVKQILKKCKTCVLVFSLLVSTSKSDANAYADIPNTVFSKAKNEPDFIMRSLLFSSDAYNSSATSAFEEDVTRMRDFAQSKGKKIFFVGIPHDLQTSAVHEAFYSGIGFETSSAFQTDWRVQNAFQNVCVKNMLTCYDTSSDIRERTTMEELYWPRDEHFRPEGYALVAEKIAQHIVAQLQ